MSTRTEKTQELHSKGYNCAQAVAVPTVIWWESVRMRFSA